MSEVSPLLEELETSKKRHSRSRHSAKKRNKRVVSVQMQQVNQMKGCHKVAITSQGVNQPQMKESESIDSILKRGMDKGASDIHFSVGKPTVFRIRGELMDDATKSVLTKTDCVRLAKELCDEEQWQTLETMGEVDLSYEIKQFCRFRVNIFKQRQGISIAIRVIPQKIPELSSLKLPTVLETIIDTHQGLILVTGPTGSGKSTTMASMLQHLCQRRKKHLITLEDPVEYVYEATGSLINQREIGHDTKSFQNAFRAALRQDPDIILVGELRDFETISIALTAAETGHLVLGTLHTSSAATSVERIIDVFPSNQQDQVRTQLSSALVSIISQRLLPTRDNKGRVAVTEVLVNDKSVANLIRSGKTHQIDNVLQTSRDKGMHTMESAIQKALADGLIDYQAAETLMKEER